MLRVLGVFYSESDATLLNSARRLAVEKADEDEPVAEFVSSFSSL